MKTKFFSKSGSRSGFTLLEIAVSLAVIGFAIVAVIGVLPTGLNIQRDTRERTVVMQDAKFFIEAIRQGGKGTNDLLSNVERLWVAYDKGPDNPPQIDELVRGKHFTRDSQIIEYLTLPRFGNFADHLYTVALVRSLSGPASEKGANSGDDRIAFSYFVRTEVVPITSVPNQTFTSTSTLDQREVALRKTQLNYFRRSLQEVKLTMMWPPLPAAYRHDWVPKNQVSFRTFFSGSMTNNQQRVLQTGRFL